MSLSGLAQELPLPPDEFGFEVCVTAAALELLRIGVGHHHAGAFAGDTFHLFAVEVATGLLLGGGEEGHQRGNEHGSKIAA